MLADIDAIAAIRALCSSPFSGQLIGNGADFGVIPRAETETGTRPSPDAIVKHTLLALSSRFLRRSFVAVLALICEIVFLAKLSALRRPWQADKKIDTI